MAKKDFIFKPYRPGDEHQLNWRDEKLLDFFSRSVALWEPYFRYEIIGLDRVPRKGGALLANNHGLVPFDVILLTRHLVAMGRAPRALAEHATWRFPIIRELLLNMGVVDGNPRNAIRLLRDGELVIVFPGGAREGLKSFKERYNLYWEDRFGFVKVAIAAGVPIVPCFSAGIDHCYYVVANAYDIGKKYFGRYIPLPLFVGAGLIPFPVKIRHVIGKPIVHDLPRTAYRDPKIVAKLHRRVLSAMVQLKAQALADYKPWHL